jgi:uncharacterized protein involved in response to NO
MMASIGSAIRATVPRFPRDYSGPTLFSYGFRPFFLAGSVWAAVAILVWIPQYFGEFILATALAPRDWHIHEMLYGYLAAVIAGFLLTAIPNWTGRLPVAGLPLAALFAIWAAGRVAMLLAPRLGAAAAAVVDIAFLVSLAAVALREVVAGRNWRNLRVVGVLFVLIGGNVVFHAEAAISGAADYGIRVGIAAAIALIMLIGGRIIPSFTHNFLIRVAADGSPGRLPQSFSRVDAVAMAVAAVALVAWIAAPSWPLTAVMLVAAGALHAVRMARWAGDRTLSDRLVLALHVGYGFVPLGFLLIGLASLRPDLIPPSAGAHAWTAGAVGMMTMAVMTRATLGHAGRPLVASRATETLYVLVVIAALARLAASFAYPELLLHAAAFAWVGAFGGFALVYGPMLLTTSRSARSRC